MTEADVSAKLRVALCEFGAVAWKVSDRFHASRPDLVICHQGRFIAIETKMAPNSPTAAQTFTLTELVGAGAQVYVATYDKRDKTLAILSMYSGSLTSFKTIKEAAQWLLKQSSLLTKREALS
jgi:hypothetical protein